MNVVEYIRQADLAPRLDAMTFDQKKWSESPRVGMNSPRMMMVTSIISKVNNNTPMLKVKSWLGEPDERHIAKKIQKGDSIIHKDIKLTAGKPLYVNTYYIGTQRNADFWVFYMDFYEGTNGEVVYILVAED